MDSDKIIARNSKYPVVLSIAGSDSGGGAGIQADLKTISALGCFGTTAITAITAQNTLGIQEIFPIPETFVSAQIKSVIEDMKPAAIKIGMLHSASLAIAVADTLRQYCAVPVIFDPVMLASSGGSLVTEGTIDAFKNALFPLVTLLTPNLDEAAILAQMKVKNLSDMKEAALRIQKMGCQAVLVKGGHLNGTELFDVYRDKNGIEKIFNSSKINSFNTHGTGCSLSSAIASYIARNAEMDVAISKARQYVWSAILHGSDVRSGSGPGALNHGFNPEQLIKYALKRV